MGIGITLGFVIVSLVVAWRSDRHRLGQAVYFTLVGLVLAAGAPGLADSTNQFITGIVHSIQSINWSK